LTYAFDSILSRTAYFIYLLPQDQETSFGGIYRVVFVLIGLSTSIYDDYRMDFKALFVALAGFYLFSLSKVVSKIGPRIEFKGARTWETPLHIYLLAGLPPLVMASYATCKYENYVAAANIAQTWSMLYKLVNFGPGVLLQILFASSMNTAYPFVSQNHVGGALEDSSGAARDAAASTLQAGFWTICFGVLGREESLINWSQVMSFMIIYLVTVGPKVIGYYPPRALNLLLRIMRRRQLPVRSEPWQFKFFLLTTTTIFAVLMSSNLMFWVDTVAYARSLRSWHGLSSLTLDTTYRPPTLRSFDIVIAHSAGDPISTIVDLLASFAVGGPLGGLLPSVTVYTQDPNFDMAQSSADNLRDASSFGGALSIQTLRNVGGVSATHLHHILYAWDRFPVQTLFLSTSPSTFNSSRGSPTLDLVLDDNLTLLHNRLSKYFIAPAFPLPDAAPKTGFLNLGPLETCSCNQCIDSLGWDDSFHLVPSMWSAARPGSKTCDNVLLTRGNNFIASAARIRGVKKEVWQLLYDALVNEDVVNAWAHDADKMPKMLPGEEGMGRWSKGDWVPAKGVEPTPEPEPPSNDKPAPKSESKPKEKTQGDKHDTETEPGGTAHEILTDIIGAIGNASPSSSSRRDEPKPQEGMFVNVGIYGEKDSLEKPYLGMTVERLWGVLLQCSEGRIAWRCPNLETGWRRGGEEEDCGCVD
jgi:hypothetical protein